MSEINLVETTADNPVKMIKWHILLGITLVLLICLLFVVGKFGSDSLAFVFFIVFLSIPIIVYFRNEIPDYIPGPIRDFLEDDYKPSPRKCNDITDPVKCKGVCKMSDGKCISKSKISRKTKQIFMITGSAFMILAAVMLLINLKSDLNPGVDKAVSVENQTFYKIIMAMICGVISGLFILNIDTIGLN
jgi:hypothetical protein